MKIRVLGLLCSLFYLLPLLQISWVHAQSLQVQNFYPSNTVAPATKYVFTQTQDGLLLAANEKAELYSFQNGNWIGEEISNEISTAIRAIQFDGSDRLWLGTQFQGIFIKNGEDWIRFHTMNSGIYSNNIFDIVFDGQGQTWINHGAFGLSKWDGTNWTSYNSENGDLPFGMITGIANDGDNKVWCGVGKYLLDYTDGDWVWLDLDQYFNQEGMIISHLRWIDDELLIASNKGLFTMNEEGEWKWLSETLGNVLITNAGKLLDGRYCFAEAGYGIHFEEEGIISSYFGNTANQVPPIVAEMEVDMEGIIWLANGLGGITSISEVVSTTEDINKENLYFFPNPTNGRISLNNNVCSTYGQFDICVYDLMGQLKAFKKDACGMDLDFLASGWYRVMIKSQKQQEVWTKSILIQH